jgi:hypothetical protein
LLLLSAAACIKPEPPATKEDCQSITVKMALLGSKMENKSDAEIAELMPIFEKAVADIHAGRDPEGFPPDFKRQIEQLERDCQRDFTRKDIACIRKAETVSQVIGCQLFD